MNETYWQYRKRLAATFRKQAERWRREKKPTKEASNAVKPNQAAKPQQQQAKPPEGGPGKDLMS